MSRNFQSFDYTYSSSGFVDPISPTGFYPSIAQQNYDSYSNATSPSAPSYIRPSKSGNGIKPPQHLHNQSHHYLQPSSTIGDTDFDNEPPLLEGIIKLSSNVLANFVS